MRGAHRPPRFKKPSAVLARMRTSDEIRERLKAWETATAPFSLITRLRNTLSWVPSELKWVLGEDDAGALRKLVWVCLVGELHDAECTVRKDGPDLILEGTGHPADFEHPRTFRFWLRLIRGRFEDERGSRLAIEKIWILYNAPEDQRFALTAQDDTLSGIIEFSGDEFEFRIRDHVNLPAKK